HRLLTRDQGDHFPHGGLFPDPPVPAAMLGRQGLVHHFPALGLSIGAISLRLFRHGLFSGRRFMDHEAPRFWPVLPETKSTSSPRQGRCPGQLPTPGPVPRLACSGKHEDRQPAPPTASPMATPAGPGHRNIAPPPTPTGQSGT